jgi:glycosyltransferase involved in cell wall biosynthesis
MKKVLLISNRVMHYRVSIYNYFARNFREYGWDFIVRANALQKKNPHSLRFNFKEIPFRFLDYRREIKEIRPDVVILFLHLRDYIIWPLLFWLKLAKIPVVFWTKGFNLDNPKGRLSRILYKYMHARFDGLILYSAHEIESINPKHRHKISVANNTVNFEDYPEVPEGKEEIKKELGIPFDKVVLSVGRMEEGGGRKKIDHLIEVFRNINLRGAGLVIVGSGVNSELLGRMNKENTIYLGEIYDPQHLQISKIFKMADLFSIPGHVGLGLNQAFVWGLPVVTEDGLQPPEIHYLVDGRNGFIVPNNDVEELMKRIVFLLENDEKRNKMGRIAREDIVRNASVSRMFLGFKEIIDHLVDGR